MIPAPSGLFSLPTSLGREYVFVNKSKTWTEAQRHCREEFADLASVHSQDDSNTLLSVMVGPEYSLKVWIGLYDITRWRWSLGNEEYNKEFSNWVSGEPDFAKAKQNCTVMTAREGKWMDDACEEEHPAVCYY
ncbi:hypothetical protein LDENG_00035340, partial [Lucifuga dentata]